MQTGAVELPKSGPGFIRYRRNGANHFGRPRLVSALTRIAAELERDKPGMPPIVIGDLSARFGGKIPGHQSHRNGRDVDLLFHYLTPSGARVIAPGFIRVGTDGLARVPDTGQILRLDIEHEWRVVRALVSAEELGCSSYSSSRTVEALLIEYALALAEPLELVLRAQSVMLHPGTACRTTITSTSASRARRRACRRLQRRGALLGAGCPCLRRFRRRPELLALLADEPPLDPLPESGDADMPAFVGSAIPMPEGGE